MMLAHKQRPVSSRALAFVWQIARLCATQRHLCCKYYTLHRICVVCKASSKSLRFAHLRSTIWGRGIDSATVSSMDVVKCVIHMITMYLCANLHIIHASTRT
jgi:hypothetical protein